MPAMQPATALPAVLGKLTHYSLHERTDKCKAYMGCVGIVDSACLRLQHRRVGRMVVLHRRTSFWFHAKRGYQAPQLI